MEIVVTYLLKGRERYKRNLQQYQKLCVVGIEALEVGVRDC